MAISDRISAMYDHIGDIYDTLELGGDTTQNKNIVNINTEIKREYKDFLANGTDTLWNNWEKVSGAGTEITLNNTMEGKMKVDLKGNTYQYSTTGKNLLDKNTTNILNAYINPSTGKIATSGVNKTIYLQLEPNTTYTLSFDKLDANGDAVNLSTDNSAFAFFDNTPQVNSIGVNPIELASATNHCEETFTTDSTHIWFAIKVVHTSKANYDKTIATMQIEKGNQATPYEPYTGNQPSPNPDYPQDIQVVSGDNSIKVANGDNTEYEEYPISLGNIELCKIGDYQDKIAKSTGKNLLNSNSFETFTSSIQYLTFNVEPNTNYTLSSNIPTEGNSSNLFIIGSSGSPTTSTNGVSPNSPRTFNSSNDGIIRVGYRDSGSALTDEKTKYWYMLNEGTTALPYEPYGKVWYLNKQIGKVVLDGSEDGWYVANSGTSNWFYRINSFYYGLVDLYVAGKCNYYSCVDINNNNTVQGISASAVGHGLFIRYGTEDTIDNFKNWLSTHNTTVYYILATPTYTEITGELLSQLEALAYSYDEQTNISQVNDDLASELDVTALEDI